jgi:hypothetical protein
MNKIYEDRARCHPGQRHLVADFLELLAIPREISSRSTSVIILRSSPWCSSSTASPTIYTKINCFHSVGIKLRRVGTAGACALALSA